ncbi:hypothetical protein BKA66DRAFT_422126 [Pyrenochaeta sp. MPI-SDFR-AT-0127]|nr:hypothetical protein BKA66DRAFT_422126 [Pyrenochaeta sp. MPI-SDFR-AT-0127]
MGGQARGRGAGRVKRQQVEAEDGWTVITHGLSNMSLAKGKKKDNEQAAGSLPTKSVDGLTPEKLLADFKKLQERWEDTALAHQMADLMARRKWNVGHAVCIGIGSFSRDWAHRWRSLWQLVLFIAIIDHLKQSDPNSELKEYAQEPAFTTLDVEFLGLLGVAVVDSDVQAHITETSFVYSPFVDWYLLLPTFLVGKNPALYVGNEILDDYTPYAQTEEKQARLAECNGLGKAFLGVREKARLGDFEAHGSALQGMVVYWKAEGGCG